MRENGGSNGVENTSVYCKDLADTLADTLRNAGYFAAVPFTEGHYFVVVDITNRPAHPTSDQESRTHLTDCPHAIIIDAWEPTGAVRIKFLPANIGGRDYSYDLWDVDYGH